MLETECKTGPKTLVDLSFKGKDGRSGPQKTASVWLKAAQDRRRARKPYRTLPGGASSLKKSCSEELYVVGAGTHSSTRGSKTSRNSLDS